MNTSNYAYVSIITSENYIEGLAAMWLSLKKTRTSIPLCVLVPSVLYGQKETLLESCLFEGVLWIKYDVSIEIPNVLEEKNKQAKENRWNFTFDKLMIFDLTQFEKIVFIDSDMFVLRNLDHLFKYPHMSACCAGALFPGNEDWIDLNSGLMVIEPQKGLAEKICGVIPNVMRKKTHFGDQDVLQEYYYEWPGLFDRHLSECYNLFAPYASYYERGCGFFYSHSSKNDKCIAVIHFIGESKPWFQQWTKLSIIKQELKLQYFHLVHQRNTECIFLEYKKMIREIRKMLRSG